MNVCHFQLTWVIIKVLQWWTNKYMVCLWRNISRISHQRKWVSKRTIPASDASRAGFMFMYVNYLVCLLVKAVKADMIISTLLDLSVQRWAKLLEKLDLQCAAEKLIHTQLLLFFLFILSFLHSLSYRAILNLNLHWRWTMVVFKRCKQYSKHKTKNRNKINANRNIRSSAKMCLNLTTCCVP